MGLNRCVWKWTLSHISAGYSLHVKEINQISPIPEFSVNRVQTLRVENSAGIIFANATGENEVTQKWRLRGISSIEKKGGDKNLFITNFFLPVKISIFCISPDYMYNDLHVYHHNPVTLRSFIFHKNWSIRAELMCSQIVSKLLFWSKILNYLHYESFLSKLIKNLLQIKECYRIGYKNDVIWFPTFWTSVILWVFL